MKLRAAFGLVILVLAAESRAQVREPPAVPPPAAVQAAQQDIADAYQKELAAASTPALKKALAQRLTADGVKTAAPVEKYALWQTARGLAEDAGDIDAALKIVDLLTTNFNLRGGSVRLEVFTRAASKLKTPGDHHAFVRYLGRELPAVVQADDFESALALGELAAASAKKSGETAFVKTWSRRQAELKSQADAHRRAEDARKTLEVAPTDAAANAAVGKYLCLIQEDWERGLPLLALGNDAALQTAAAAELKGAATTEAQLKLADAWYDLAAGQSDFAKQSVLRYAAKRYRQVASGLTGLVRRRVDLRLEEIAAAASPFVKDEWVEILDLANLDRHQVMGRWKRDGLAVVTASADCRVLRLPVVVDGDYELRIRAKRSSGSEGLSVSLSNTAAGAEFWLDRGGGSAVSKVDGKNGADNSSKVVTRLIKDNVPFDLTIRVERRDDTLGVLASWDNKKFYQWSGAVSRIGKHHPEWPPDIHLISCDSEVTFYSVQLKLKSGSASLTK